jgi:hypothetical protein
MERHAGRMQERNFRSTSDQRATPMRVDRFSPFTCGRDIKVSPHNRLDSLDRQTMVTLTHYRARR